MNSSFRSGLMTGVLLGGAVAAGLVLLLRPPPEPVRVPLPPPPVAERPAGDADEVRALQARIAELEKKAAASAPEAAKKDEKPAVEKPAAPDLASLFGKLGEAGLGGFRSPKFGETLEAVKSGGKPAIEYLSNILRTSKSATERFMAAALLEGAGDAGGVDALAAVLKGDSDDMVRRMASHALAVIGSPGAEGPLREATSGDSDWGVRANSAYGLAKLGKDDGLKLLREFYESTSTPAEYRLPVLAGLADVAAPSTAPLFRKILSDTKDPSYLLVSIGALEKMKDAESLTALQQLADSTQPELVRQAAAKAVAAIRKE